MKKMSLITVLALLVACGGGGSDSNEEIIPAVQCALVADNSQFNDADPVAGKIGGPFIINMPNNCNATALIGRWADAQGNVIEAPRLTVDVSGQAVVTLDIPMGTPITTKEMRLLITPIINDSMGASVQFTIQDTVHVTGPGGTYLTPWEYGDERPPLALTAQNRGDQTICVFDNGNVLVHDSEFEEYSSPAGKPNTPDDLLYRPYEFDCTTSQRNEHRKTLTEDDDGNEVVHNYSAINDAMYYGNVVFDMYEKLLGVRPLDKLRIRAHYGYESDYRLSGFWDGAYVNLNDDVFESLGLANLETISHETTHAILNQHSSLIYITDAQYHIDALMLHEAFADMSTVMAYYSLYGELNWVYGDENNSSRKRYLDRVETEDGAIPSYFDYDEAGANFYKRMGMMTYPFYLLTQQWGVEKAFSLFLASAKSCWQPDSEIKASANCVLQTAQLKGYESDAVIKAFRSVKIQLKDQDTLSHYQMSAEKLRTQFTANPQSDRAIVSYYWEFGDGQTSNEASPHYEYGAKGDYTPKLTIKDDQGVTDSFSRSLSVTDEYCAPGSLAVKKREFDSVTINGVNINFDADRYDYSGLPAIDVTAGNAFTIAVTGTVLNTEKPKTTWYVRIDLNDDGEFSFKKSAEFPFTDEELLRLEQDDNAYSFNQAITVPAEYSGKTLHMRLSGDTLGSFSACSVYLGTVVDVRLNVL